MRPVQMADLDAAMRLLLKVPSARRRLDMADLCARADIADRYRKRLRRLHPDFGDGTLMAAAMGQGLAPRPAAVTAEALSCLHIVLAVLQDKSSHQLS